MRAHITLHIYLIDESASHLILLMMTKINNFDAFSQPTITQEKISLKRLLT